MAEGNCRALLFVSQADRCGKQTIHLMMRVNDENEHSLGDQVHLWVRLFPCLPGGPLAQEGPVAPEAQVAPPGLDLPVWNKTNTFQALLICDVVGSTQRASAVK